MGDEGEGTKELLLDAAEILMARRGIEGAELNDIHRLAGQRNRSAIAYHFGDRDGLLQAIGARRRAPVNRARNALLDRLEQAQHVSIGSLADALVRPPAVDLQTPNGRCYLIVLAEAATRLGSTNMLVADRTHLDSVHRLSDLLIDHLSGSMAWRRRTISRVLLVTPILLADIAREIDHEGISRAVGRRRVGEVADHITRSLATPRTTLEPVHR